MTQIVFDQMPGGEEMVTEPVEVNRICGTCGSRISEENQCLMCRSCGWQIPDLVV